MDTTGFLPTDQYPKDINRSRLQNTNYHQNKTPIGDKNKITNNASQQGEHFQWRNHKSKILFLIFPFLVLGFFSFSLIIVLVLWWQVLIMTNPCKSWEVYINTFWVFYISMYFNSFCFSYICKIDKFCKLLKVCVIQLQSS